METVRLGRTTTLIPFVRFLSELGSPVARELENHRLPVGLLDLSEEYIPTLNNWAFVDTMARSQDVRDLGLRVAEPAGLDAASQGLRAKLRSAPTLLSALRIFCTECARDSSGMSCRLATGGDEVGFHLRKSFGPEVPGYSQTEWLGVMVMMSVVRLFAGADWQPAQISLRTLEPIPVLARERFPMATISAGQQSTFFTIPRPLLRLRLKREKLPPAVGPMNDEAPACDLLGGLRQLLPAYLPDGHPQIELAAELLGTSARTLQRRLADEGLSYSCVVEGVRMLTAASLLADPGRPVLEISRHVGYSDPSNFARAFRRYAGESPTSYRAGRADTRAASTAASSETESRTGGRRVVDSRS